MTEGVIIKALSGFYYVQAGDELLSCRARGKFRLDGTSPLVGDRVFCSPDGAGGARVDRVAERRNWFVRPAVANVDALVFVAANVNPITDPFLPQALIDRGQSQFDGDPDIVPDPGRRGAGPSPKTIDRDDVCTAAGNAARDGGDIMDSRDLDDHGLFILRCFL